MDIDAVLARRPEVALVDEFAHTNVPGSRNEKRWQDVEELLEAGIDVISNVNIQHLESLNDVVEKITGVPQRETVPDAIVRAADQVELVDMTPEALRRRMAHGNIYPAEKIDAALTHYFRAGNLAALRELALLWLADKVDEGLQRYRAAHDIHGTWEARERVVVALTGGPEGDTLIRRAARIAARSSGGDLLAVHVTKSDGLTGANPAALAEQRRLVESLGGTLSPGRRRQRARGAADLRPGRERDPARARREPPQLAVGAAHRARRQQPHDPRLRRHRRAHRDARADGPRPGAAAGPRRAPAAAQAGGLRPGGRCSRRCSPCSWPASAAAINLTSDVLFFLVAVIAVALVGGFVPAVLEAIAGSLLLNYYFTPPIHQWTIAEANNALALGIFVAVGLVVSSVVDGAARRSKQAARASAESEMLVTAAGSVLRGQQALAAVLDRVREAFGMESVTLLERAPGPAGPRGPVTGWVPVATSGGPALTRPEDADVDVPITDSLTLGLRGRALPASDRRVLGAFAAYAAAALEQQRLAAEAEAARPIAEADRMRTALLAAVSHDLRTPLASAKAAVTSLRSRDVQWTPEDRDELLATADESLDRLAHLVDNLLDMSRLQAGALVGVPPAGRPGGDRLPVAGRPRPCGPGRSSWTSPPTLPEVRVDPAILERVIANLTANALRYSPAGSPPLLTGERAGRPGGAAHRGPRPRDSRGRPGPDLRAVPAARRHRQHHRASGWASRCPAA